MFSYDFSISYFYSCDYFLVFNTIKKLDVFSVVKRIAYVQISKEQIVTVLIFFLYVPTQIRVVLSNVATARIFFQVSRYQIAGSMQQLLTQLTSTNPRFNLFEHYIIKFSLLPVISLYANTQPAIIAACLQTNSILGFDETALKLRTKRPICSLGLTVARHG